MSNWLQLATAWKAAQQRDERVLLFTLIDVTGSSYRKVGAHMLATETGTITGSVSAGCVEADLIARLPDLFASFPSEHTSSEDNVCRGQVISYSNISDEQFSLNRGCNGDLCIYIEELYPRSVNSLSAFAKAQSCRAPQVHLLSHPQSKIFVERIMPPVRLYLFGSLRDAEPVAALARSLDMEVQAVRKTDAHILTQVSPDSRTAILIMSHDFERDREALLAVVGEPFPYVGVMGPRYRTEDMLSHAPSVAANVQYPVGLDIGAEGAEEIAVSIMAELIQTFRRDSARVLTVLLAAGEAKRFGSPKQVALINGTSFVRRAALESLNVPESAATAVVLGAYADEVERELAGLPVKAIYNEHYETGMGSSIAAAARYAEDQGFSGLLLMTCDQIHITRNHLSELIRGACGPVAASYADTVGIPCYFPRQFFAELQNIAPNAGAKLLLQTHAATLRTVKLPEAGCDIDLREQLVAAQSQVRPLS